MSLRAVRIWLVLSLVALATPALGHSTSSAQWRLVQRDAHTWDARLRLPEDFEGRLLSLKPHWPAGCTLLEAPRHQPAEEATIVAWRLRCAEGLRGTLGLSGFTAQLPDAVVRLEPLQGAVRHAVLSASQPTWSPEAAPAPPLAHYLPLGVEHILLGPDHLLFVLGLWALWRRGGRGLGALIGTLTAFTIAHSITLAGATLGGWQLPTAVVEACIAASILLLAVELAGGERGLAARRPAVVAFGFGLLHGFGFAGALAETGLPPDAQAWALAAFNIGVELGQVGFVLALLLVARLAAPWRVLAPAALGAYGAVAAYWVIERTAWVLA